MKTSKLVFVLVGICLFGIWLVFFVTGLAIAGPSSAKFAATWNTKPGLASVVAITNASEDTVAQVDPKTGSTLAAIKVLQDKER